MNSSILVQSVVSAAQFTEGKFRSTYLARYQECEPPHIAINKFIPKELVDHLMRNKKDAAIGVKYRPGDDITNIEGALHTFVTPIVPALIQGDYAFEGAHIVPPFGELDGKMLARPVLVSCLVQPDFEFNNVMYELIKLEEQAIEGEELQSFEVPSKEHKIDPSFRAEYDARLKRHIIYHTVGTLPAKSEAIEGNEIIESHGNLLSLEMLRKIISYQLSRELSVISSMAPQGFVYTWDPPAIFARYLSAEVINKLWVEAMVKALKGTTCKLVAFNDYADKSVIGALASQTNVPVTSKSSIFPGNRLDMRELKDCVLVLHNNSDAFGQNIESESAYGSLDGAIGSASSTSASLKRTRRDLLDRYMSD